MRTMKDLPYHAGLTVKIYPSNQQKHLIAVNDGVKRAVYNHLVATGNERYRMKKTAEFVPVYKDRLAYLDTVTGTKGNIMNAMPFLCGKDVDSLAIDNAMKNYSCAWKNMKEQHKGVPVFKKKSYEQSYQTNAHYYPKDTSDGHNTNVWFLDRAHVTLPKLGRVRIGASPETIDMIIGRQETREIRIGTVTIRRDSVGEYWASFQIASGSPFYGALPSTGNQQGIDLNLIELVVDSDGGVVENPKYLKQSMDRLARAQHKLSRMAERAKKENRSLRESRNYQKQRKKVAYLNRLIARQRKDFLHRVSKGKIESQDFIAAEDLKVRNLKRNHKLARSISDAGWRTLLTMLQYKAEFYGKTVVLVPPGNTTQTCSVCGHIMSGDAKLTPDIREWDCPACHTHHNRDVNAARNILKRGIQTVYGQS